MLCVLCRCWCPVSEFLSNKRIRTCLPFDSFQYFNGHNQSFRFKVFWIWKVLSDLFNIVSCNLFALIVVPHFYVSWVLVECDLKGLSFLISWQNWCQYFVLVFHNQHKINCNVGLGLNCRVFGIGDDLKPQFCDLLSVHMAL